jgi:2-polyprenyl-3-methyl-5-hydroxy-6-metoxy-1,4-benzoquinol methylase
MLYSKKQNKRIPIIEKGEAIDALKTINRKPLNAFTFFKRSQNTSKEIDILEERWWNTAGTLIEDVWGLPDDLCLAYRQEYVMKAKDFFLTDKQHTKVLDLGCGTGWFGRIIACEKIFYQGIDFSETQINIAKEKVKNTHNERYIHYTQTTSIQSIKNIHDFDGIIINAFLHHLCKDELKKLFSDIKQNFKSGTKIFIMEPVYPTNKVKKNITITEDAIANVISDTIAAVKKHATEINLFDTQKELLLSELINESDDNGFFFSPKEVPFDFQEIELLLLEYTQLRNYFYVGVNDFSLLQMLSFVKDQNYRKEMIKTIFPIIKTLDKQLIDKEYYANGVNSYIFTCFECILL